MQWSPWRQLQCKWFSSMTTYMYIHFPCRQLDSCMYYVLHMVYSMSVSVVYCVGRWNYEQGHKCSLNIGGRGVLKTTGPYSSITTCNLHLVSSHDWELKKKKKHVFCMINDNVKHHCFLCREWSKLNSCKHIFMAVHIISQKKNTVTLGHKQTSRPMC